MIFINMDIKDRFKIATVQLNSRLGDVKTNLTRAIDYIDQAVSLGAEIILFPELYLQGYCADQDLTKTSETIPGPTTDVLLGVSKKYNVYIVMGKYDLRKKMPLVVQHCDDVYSSSVGGGTTRISTMETRKRMEKRMKN